MGGASGKPGGGSIARNTLFLYLRMLVTLCVTLYTSRVVIQALGIIDFGIYDAVAGVSTSFIFFQSALSTSTQRFLNYEMERNGVAQVRRIFSMSLLIYAGIALVVLMAAFLLGDWLVQDKLQMPDSQRPAATVVMWTLVFSLCLLLLASVYESALIARENMKLYAYIGIIDAVAKLGIAFAVMYLPNKLVTYAVLVVVAQLAPYIIMVVYCLRHYPETRPRWYWNWGMFRQLFGFTGWNLYGSAIWMVNEQGITILLNIFFGPVVNAARGVAARVNNAVNNFNTQFFTAVRPQLIKRYAAEETARLKSLIFASTKFSVFLLFLLCLPIMLRVDYIMDLWLDEVPEWTGPFVVWTLVYTMVNSLNNPTYTAVSATGHLRRTVLIGSNLFLLAFPLGYLALKAGLPPYSVYPMLMAGRFAFFLVAIRELKRYVPVSYGEYLKKCAWPVGCVVVPVTAVMMGLNALIPQCFWGLLAEVTLSLAITCAAIMGLGVTAPERAMVTDKLKSILKKFRK